MNNCQRIKFKLSIAFSQNAHFSSLKPNFSFVIGSRELNLVSRVIRPIEFESTDRFFIPAPVLKLKHKRLHFLMSDLNQL